jgi:S-adenosylmethionine-diacylglycerol 3-amino-3-carboxypropyl transferase
MGIGNSIQFAVVREDPQIELEIIEKSEAEKVLLVGSGGCTAFTLTGKLPKVNVTLFDTNPAQLELIRKKMELLSAPVSKRRLSDFGVGNDAPGALTNCGNFESLFRSLKSFIREFVVTEDELSAWDLEKVFKNKYWPIAFEIHFSDALLNAMFGPDATQHAPPGSYPGYFMAAIEMGLRQKNAFDNYFLHHILFGSYSVKKNAQPEYLHVDHVSTAARLKLIEGDLFNVKDLGAYDVIGLSNIFDWMPETAVKKHAAMLCKSAKPGSALIYRQLNHSKDFQSMFADAYHFDESAATRLLSRDRSLFYSKLNIGYRKGKAP